MNVRVWIDELDSVCSGTRNPSTHTVQLYRIVRWSGKGYDSSTYSGGRLMKTRETDRIPYANSTFQLNENWRLYQRENGITFQIKLLQRGLFHRIAVCSLVLWDNTTEQKKGKRPKLWWANARPTSNFECLSGGMMTFHWNLRSTTSTRGAQLRECPFGSDTSRWKFV